MAILYLEHQEVIEGVKRKVVHLVNFHWVGGVQVMVYAKWVGRGADFVKLAYHYLIKKYHKKDMQKLYMQQACEEFAE